ncbi:MAG: PIG-L family deacetylase [Candidatus Omnitrophica bacterium]|nr:PIG-L family deacetylase [Candidatus Omnitrophota bacterium]
MSNVLVLAVHPDDETLGCGGTLLKHKASGDNIYWLIATAMKEESGFNKKQIEEREHEIDTVKGMYGFSELFNLDIPTTKADKITSKELITKISDIFNNVKPEIIYLPFMHDVHSDHRVIFDAAYSCTKTFRYPFIRKILMMETISETELAPPTKETIFIPNSFVNISNFMDKKLEIMRVFESEHGNHPFPRSPETIKAIATARGAIAGCKFAEGFMVLREIL